MVAHSDRDVGGGLRLWQFLPPRVDLHLLAAQDGEGDQVLANRSGPVNGA